MLMPARPPSISDELPIDAVLDEIGRFCAEELAPRFARHEDILPTAQIRRLHDALTRIGTLSADDAQPSGLALWETPDSVEGRHLSLSMLGLVAQHNMALAWSMHQHALASLLQRRLGVAAVHAARLALQGRYGLARDALAMHLAGRSLDADNRALLWDYFDATRAPGLLVQALDDWQALWLPQPVKDSGLQWQCWRREQLVVEPCPHPHGFDELSLSAVTIRPGMHAMPMAALESAGDRQLMTELLTLNALAQLAIGAGGVEHAQALARDYAAQRRQGGELICRHPAVRLLLATPAEARMLVAAALSELVQLDPIEPATLARVFRARAALQPRLCAAASDALQVFGGMGYMQDTGMEKILRDQNTLRVIHGTPVELQLAAEILEGAQP